MKSAKITRRGKPPGKRWYDDACGTALGLELVGERWSLLIVRELMFGGRRFSDLRSGLPGVSANILAQRLEGLEHVGIVQRRKLPPPASVQIYELTPWGYEAEVVLQELGRWATRSPLHDPTLPLSAASIMMSFRTMYSRERAKGEAARIGFRFGEEGFVVDFGPEGVRTRRGEPEACAVVVSTNPMSLASVVYGGRPVVDAEDSGELKLTGDRALVDRFVGWFALPEKIVWAVPTAQWQAWAMKKGASALAVATAWCHVSASAGVSAVLATMAMVLPAAALVLVFARLWGRAHGSPWRFAFEHGLAPIAVGLIASSGIIVARAADHTLAQFALTALATVLFCTTKVNPILVVALAGLFGGLGLVWAYFPAESLRSQPTRHPAIILTAYAFRYPQAALARFNVMLKPVRPAELLDAVAKVLNP